MEIGPDLYGRYDFVERNLAKDIHRALSKFIDVEQYKVSHRFYMNKYWPNSSYVDGHITDAYGNKSVRTVLVYLNTCKGGETVIDSLRVQPRTGRVLLLGQDVMHEAGPPTDGYKYILRTDLIQHSVTK